MAKFKRVKRDGKDVVVVEQEAVVNIHVLRKNHAEYKQKRDEFQRMMNETEEFISEVEAIAPDLLEEADKANGLEPLPKSRQRKRSAKRKVDRKRSRRKA
jgi:hypothetical protein